MILFSVDVTGMFNQTADSPFQEEPNWNNEEAGNVSPGIVAGQTSWIHVYPLCETNSEPSWLRV